MGLIGYAANPDPANGGARGGDFDQLEPALEPSAGFVGGVLPTFRRPRC